MRRSREPLKLERNPLVYVLCQVRFAPVLSVGEKVPAAQEAFRRMGYPRFTATEIQEVDLGQPSASTAWSTIYRFLDRESVSAYILASDSFSFEVTSYTTFEKFVGRFLDGLGVIAQVVEPSLIERIGLRYVDLIQPREGESLTAWLQPGLLGLSGLPLLDAQSRFELRGKTEQTQFLFRATRPTSGFIPADLQPLQVIATAPEPLRSGEYVVLDLDNSDANGGDFDVATVEDSLWQLHDLLDLAFRAAVTDIALDSWRTGP